MRIKIPLHVSGIWIPHYSSSPVETGSVGAGLNISIYVESLVKRGPCKILLNNEEVFPRNANELCSELGVSVLSNINSPIRLGSGFGLSAAVFITHALGSYLLVGKPSIQALQRAHVLEVVNLTGLGDVISEYTGGFTVRARPGAPGIGYAYRVIPREQVSLLVAELGRCEDTSSMLKRMSTSMIEQGRAMLRRVIETEDLKTYFDHSREFTSRLYSYTLVDDILSKVKGVIGYYLKKSALVIWIEKEYVNDIVEILVNNGIRTHFASISQVGVTVDYPP
ncbi:MAG: kinase [Desulfurococcaceae archaeon]